MPRIFAFLAAVAFALAILLHLIGHGAGHYVPITVLVGLLCVALHLCAFGDALVTRRTVVREP